MFGLLDSAAESMALQNGVLELSARNVAAAQASGPDGFTRLLPSVTTSEDGSRSLTVHSEHSPQNGALTEMIAVLDAQRTFEGDATVYAAAKHITEREIDLDRT